MQSPAEPRRARSIEPIIILLDDRRQQWLAKFEAFQQGAAAVVLVSAGYARLQSEPAGGVVFGSALMAAGAALFAIAVRELRGHPSRRAGLLNLVAGVALLTEWGVSVADGGKLFKPSLVMGIISIGLGLLHHRIQRRRADRRMLRMDAEGLSFRLNLFRRFRVRWSELAWISVHPSEIRLGRRTGRQHRIPLGRLVNAREVCDAVVAACRDAGVESRVPGAAAS
jgi:hypothetical protein